MSGNQFILKSQYSKGFILFKKIVRYLQIGVLLHLMAVAGLLCFFFFWQQTLIAFEQGNLIRILINLYLSIYFFSLPIFSQLDARSRYQNYKMIKDKFFSYGFDERIVGPFVYSRCQRDAIRVAAKELNFTSEVKRYFSKKGFRWYHILPHLVVRNPKILLTKSYWQKTLFVKTYKSKYFLW